MKKTGTYILYFPDKKVEMPVYTKESHMKHKTNFTYKVIKNGKTIGRCQTHSIRRFYHRIGSINWQNKQIEVYLRVSYGKFPDHRGKTQIFYNTGTYTNKKDFDLALNAFLEK